MSHAPFRANKVTKVKPFNTLCRLKTSTVCSLKPILLIPATNKKYYALFFVN